MSGGASDLPEARLARFFRQVVDAFQRAARAAGGVATRLYQIGGYPVRLQFAGEALVPRVTPPLAHLPSAGGRAPALTVCLWDSASTGVPLPPSPWNADDHYFIGGSIRGYNRRIEPGRDDYALTLLDSPSSLAVCWLPDAGRYPYVDKRLPLALILYWWMGERDLLLVHGGVVGTARGGALLGGRGGSGKSTACLVCALSGLDYAGDDYTLVRARPSPYAYSVYNTAKLDAANLARFPSLQAFAERYGLRSEGDVYFHLQEHLPERVRASLPLRAILLPRVTGRVETAAVETTAARALAAIAPSTILQLPGPRSEAFRHLAELVQSVPCYSLELGTELQMIPEVIGRLADGRRR